jgi:TldD protein
MDRRNFLRGALAAGALAAMKWPQDATANAHITPSGPIFSKVSPKEQTLAETLLTYAKSQGATYCDVRISRYRSQSVGVRERIVTGISDSDSYGIGVRVIKNGTWGFAATHAVEETSAKSAIDTAIAIATANAKLRKTPLELTPVKPVTAEWSTPIKTNPFEVPFKQRAEFLLGVHDIALKANVGGNKVFVSSNLESVREEKFFASSEGSRIWQEITRINPGSWLTVSDNKSGQFASRALFVLPQGRGFEYVENYPYQQEIETAAREAHEKINAKSVEPGNYDLILHPTHLWLTIHESVGHPTELDRALGYEANFAGTSFCTPDTLGDKYAARIVTLVADRTQEGALATVGFDDDGVPSTEYPIVKDGEFTAFQTTREIAALIGDKESHAESYAQGWWNVPFQRMPNVSLKPNPEKYSLDQMIADTENGILIKGNSSYSIDQQRYNFQFTGQVAYEVKDGKLGQMLRDVAYQSTTAEFWRNCDAICDASEYMLGGSMYDGKGEPMQTNPVSHGCPSAKFSSINVINTRSQSARSRASMLEHDHYHDNPFEHRH